MSARDSNRLKLLSIKFIFESICKNNILYDENIFEYHIVPFLEPINQIVSFIGCDNFKEFIHSRTEKKMMEIFIQ